MHTVAAFQLYFSISFITAMNSNFVRNFSKLCAIIVWISVEVSPIIALNSSINSGTELSCLAEFTRGSNTDRYCSRSAS